MTKRRGFIDGLFAIAKAIDRLAAAVEQHNMWWTRPVDLYGPRGTEIRRPEQIKVEPSWSDDS
jgi:hypothetical protein